MRLKLRRVGAGMSQRELAKRSGVPYRTIQEWERRGCEIAGAGSLKKVADVLGCTVDELLGGVDDADTCRDGR